jgi:O-methyltransferase
MFENSTVSFEHFSATSLRLQRECSALILLGVNVSITDVRADSMDVSVINKSRLSQIAQKLGGETRYRASLLAAWAELQSLYYLNLIAYYFRNTSLTQPKSFRESFRMIRMVYSVRGYTAVFVPRLVALYKLSEEVNRLSLPGDFVECGVYNGGSAAIMASFCEKTKLKRNIWLFDSFEGLPKPTEVDGHEAPAYEGWCHGDLAKVKRVFQIMGIPQDRVRVMKGWFQDTFPTVEIPQIAILHIDADWYESVKLCLEKFYDCVQPGGYIVLDDYGDWLGCKIATDEFIKARALDVRLVQVDYTGFYFQKPKR